MFSLARTTAESRRRAGGARSPSATDAKRRECRPADAVLRAARLLETYVRAARKRVSNVFVLTLRHLQQKWCEGKPSSVGQVAARLRLKLNQEHLFNALTVRSVERSGWLARKLSTPLRESNGYAGSVRALSREKAPRL